ncbi:Protein pelota [Astathelohania contejeani]|uniref:Protein pelota n=1 Tax=Astathelohania contejeani TaxID=164912 RepID=A0ABQ7HWK0_9MICR|nr:Protein pelota [Thelohania contejeani]
MQILKKSIDYKKRFGSIIVKPEYPDDIYTLYNIIDSGDTLKSITQRKVAIDDKTNQKISLTLEIEVESIHPDLESNALFVKGKTLNQHEHVRVGSYHTIDVELGQSLTLKKDYWSSLALSELEKVHVEIILMLFYEKECVVCSITQNVTKIIKRISLAKKGKSCPINDYLSRLSIEKIKLVILASFKKINLQNYGKGKDNKFIEVSLKNEYASYPVTKIASIILTDPSVSRALMDAKFIKGFKALEIFERYFASNSGMISIGKTEVEESLDYGAIKTLLITNEMFKNKDVNIRKEMEVLCDSVEKIGGEVAIVPALHFSGERVTALGGVCAILKFEHRFN